MRGFVLLLVLCVAPITVCILCGVASDLFACLVGGVLLCGLL